ncbi:MAG: restriction endonuclease subunit S [Hormoscilla sp. GM7CHS1pb]|nr:restriction endonuclease subunit S [Hormoscilla sp. GM7CHS1pb]
MSKHQLALDNSQVPEGYKKTEVGVIPEDWEVISLGELTSFVRSGKSVVKKELGNYPLYGSTGVISYSQSFEYEGDAILVARVGTAGKVNFVSGKYGVSDNTIIVKFKKNSNIHFFLYQFRKKNLNSLVFGSVQPLITGTQLKNLSVLNPKLEEQRAIAQTLSDVDGLIAALDKLIAKKRNIKTATMQELLTGKKRLPGFGEGKSYKNTEVGVIPEDWKVIKLGDILKIRHGKSQHEIIDPNGIYPILATGGEIGRTNTPLYSDPSVLIGRKGTIDSPRYMDSPFWTVETLFYSEIFKHTDAKFVFYKFYLIDWYSYNEASGVPSLNAATIEDINQAFAALKEEECAIATILSDMDGEIAALEKRRAKTQAMKQGMMQELLTGKTRLIVDNNP